MEIGDEDEESDDPQQVHMVESGEAYEEESEEEDPVPATNMSKKEASRGNASS